MPSVKPGAEPPQTLRATRAPQADVSTVILTGELPTISPSPFLAPQDEPASFEVGADVKGEPAALTEPEILVIENRSKRVAGNRGRVDGPQAPQAPQAQHGRSAYRRLFSQARKN